MNTHLHLSSVRGNVAAPTSHPEGGYSVRLRDKTLVAETLADILLAVLRRLEELAPGTLERLSQVSRRKRRMVARRRVDLYPGRPDLADMSRHVVNGWYVGTNCSLKDARAILTHASVAAGLPECLVLKSGRDAPLPPLTDLL